MIDCEGTGESFTAPTPQEDPDGSWLEIDRFPGQSSEVEGSVAKDRQPMTEDIKDNPDPDGAQESQVEGDSQESATTLMVWSMGVRMMMALRMVGNMSLRIPRWTALNLTLAIGLLPKKTTGLGLGAMTKVGTLILV